MALRKRLSFLLAAAVFPFLIHAQFTHKIKADSVRIYNDSCNAELILENSTRNISGFLFNTGNGRTQFKKAVVKLNDSSFLIGGDTLVVPKNGSIGGLTAGSVLFYDGTKIAQNNPQFFWDNTKQHLGLGTNTPNFKLDIVFNEGDDHYRTGLNMKNTNTSQYSLNGLTLDDAYGRRVAQFMYVPNNYIVPGLQETTIFSSVHNVQLGFVAAADGSATPDIYFTSGLNRLITVKGRTQNLLLKSDTTDNGNKLQVQGGISQDRVKSALVKANSLGELVTAVPGVDYAMAGSDLFKDSLGYIVPSTTAKKMVLSDSFIVKKTATGNFVDFSVKDGYIRASRLTSVNPLTLDSSSYAPIGVNRFFPNGGGTFIRYRQPTSSYEQYWNVQDRGPGTRTLADSADVELRVKYTDTISMLSGYIPYVGANRNVNIGSNFMTGRRFYAVSATGGDSSVYYAFGTVRYFPSSATHTTQFRQPAASVSEVWWTQTKGPGNHTYADSADVELRVKYTDTGAMLSSYVPYAGAIKNIDFGTNYTRGLTFTSYTNTGDSVRLQPASIVKFFSGGAARALVWRTASSGIYQTFIQDKGGNYTLADSADVAARVKYTDTAAMLSHYLRTVSWSDITGTVPTWNQNTTGNAATATSATQWGGATADFYSNGSSIANIIGQQSGGIVKPFTAAQVQGFLGLGSAAYNISSVSNTSNTVLLRDGSGDGFLRYLNTSQSQEDGAVTAIVTRQGDNYMRISGAAAVQSFLGLGSMAYASTGAYLPLSGGTMSGSIGSILNGSTAALDMTGATTSEKRVIHIGSTGTDYYQGVASSTGSSPVSGTTAYQAYFRNDQGFAFGNSTEFKYAIDTYGNNKWTGTGVFGWGPPVNYFNPYLAVSKASNDKVSIQVSNQELTPTAGAYYTSAAYGGSWYWGNGSSSSAYGNDWVLGYDISSSANPPVIRIAPGSGNTSFNSSITANSFIKSGGTSSQFLKADGSTDNTAYLPLAGGTLTGGLWGTGASFSNAVFSKAGGNDDYAYIAYKNGSTSKLGAFYQNGTGDGSLLLFNTTTDAVTVHLNGANGSASFDGTVTASGVPLTSDARLKNIIARSNSKDGIDMVSFKWKDTKKGTGLQYGYIAQEVQKKMPDAIFTNDKTGYLSVDYTQVHTVKIDQLEKKVKELEEIISKLMSELKK